MKDIKYNHMVDIVPPLEAQEYAAGGVVKGVLKALPKILGKGKPYMEKLAAPKKTAEKVLDLSKGKQTWSVMDKNGLPIKEFKTKKEADIWLKKARDEAPEKEYYENILDYKGNKL